MVKIEKKRNSLLRFFERNRNYIISDLRNSVTENQGKGKNGHYLRGCVTFTTVFLRRNVTIWTF